MNEEADNSGVKWRIVLFGAIIVIALSAIACRLHAIQIEESSIYNSSQQKQCVRRVLMPAVRGRIYDRDGVCLADNRPSYCIAFYIEEMRKPGKWANTINAVDERINALSLKLGIPRQISKDDIAKHIRQQLPIPLLAWQDIDEETVARFSELITPESGMDIYIEPERVYPFGKAAAHLIGYVGRDKPQSITNEIVHYNILGMTGRAGIERSRNETLSGTSGGKLITVNVSGYRHSETVSPPVQGKDVHLTISSKLQVLTEKLLGDRKAAVVVVDPRNGDILALASEPSFDPNDMSPRISSELWKRLQDDPNIPLLNRAISGTYPPGSTFKPAIALAALESGISPSYSVDCDGTYELGSMKLRCAARHGHGPGIDMRSAIRVSCNPYFCTLGVRTGFDKLREYCELFGFGNKTGIWLDGERSGLLPSNEWKQQVKKDGWRTGDTANLSIGQGYMLATPLQLAMYVSVIANGDTLYKPRLYKDEPVTISASVKLSKENLAVVRGGMYEVVNSPRGGGRHARVKGINVAAKTGTAEYGTRSKRKKHTWMVAYAPYEAPTIAMAVLVEDGESGGLTAAPIVSELMSCHFGITEDAYIEDEGVSEYSSEFGVRSSESQDSSEFGVRSSEIPATPSSEIPATPSSEIPATPSSELQESDNISAPIDDGQNNNSELRTPNSELSSSRPERSEEAQ